MYLLSTTKFLLRFWPFDSACTVETRAFLGHERFRKSLYDVHTGTYIESITTTERDQITLLSDDQC